MAVNVSEALDSDTAVILSYKRYTAGDYVNGIWVEGVPETKKMLASPQGSDAKTIERLASGVKLTEPMVFICNTLLKTPDDKDVTDGDHVFFGGKAYRIVRVNDWKIFGHCIAVGTRDVGAE